ncbi:MAG: endolytic transglycosylase MltG [Roseburia sp.]|nr:endolytic transglycosylase MltG [Roseburia sp.]
MKSESIVGAVCGMIFRAVFAIAAVYLIYRGTSICYDYGYRIFAEPAVSSGEGRAITVTTTEDMSPFEMGELMEKKGLVRDGRLFGLQYYCSEYRKDIKPGTFELTTAMTAEQMFEVMAAGTETASEEEDT